MTWTTGALPVALLGCVPAGARGTAGATGTAAPPGRCRRSAATVPEPA